MATMGVKGLKTGIYFIFDGMRVLLLDHESDLAR